MSRKPPKTYPQSLRITPKAIKPLAEAAGRHLQARAEAEEGTQKPHQIYLTRYKGLEALIRANREKIYKELSILQAKTQLADWEVLAHLLAALPPATLKRVFALEEISQLSVALSKRPMRRLIPNNEGLKKDEIDWNRFWNAKKDLKFQLGHNNYKSAIALILYLHMVRMSCDPTVKKMENFVNDDEVLGAANPILNYLTEAIIQHHRLTLDDFLDAPHRRSPQR